MSTTPSLPISYTVAPAPAGDTGTVQFWVLDPAGHSYEAHAARMALIAYADAIRLTHPGLAKTLTDWATAEAAAAA